MKILSEYIKAAEITRSRFAAQIGISAPFLSQIISGSRRPSIDVALRIARATDNAVPVDAWSSEAAAPSQSPRAEDAA